MITTDIMLGTKYCRNFRTVAEVQFGTWIWLADMVVKSSLSLCLKQILQKLCQWPNACGFQFVRSLSRYLAGNCALPLVLALLRKMKIRSAWKRLWRAQTRPCTLPSTRVEIGWRPISKVLVGDLQGDHGDVISQ